MCVCHMFIKVLTTYSLTYYLTILTIYSRTKLHTLATIVKRLNTFLYFNAAHTSTFYKTAIHDITDAATAVALTRCL